MNCLCCKKEDETNTELIVETNKKEHDKNNIINNDDEDIDSDNKEEYNTEQYNKKEELKKIKKLQSFYRSKKQQKNSILLPKTMINTMMQDGEKLKKVQDEYKKIQLENEKLKMNIAVLTSQNKELKKAATKLNKEKNELLKNYEDLENTKSQIIQEMELLEKQLKNAQDECTKIKNKNSQLMLKYEHLSLAKKYAEEKQNMIDKLKEKLDILQAENNILNEKCDHLQEAIQLSNKGKVSSVPISFNEINVNSDKGIRNLKKTDVKNTTINTKNSNKKRNTEDIYTLNKKGNITLESKDIQTYSEIVSNNINNKIKDTTDKNNNKFNGNKKMSLSGYFNNKETITKTGGWKRKSIYQAYKQGEDYFKNKKTNNSKISNVNNKQGLFNKI